MIQLRLGEAGPMKMKPLSYFFPHPSPYQLGSSSFPPEIPIFERGTSEKILPTDVLRAAAENVFNKKTYVYFSCISDGAALQGVSKKTI